MSSYSERPARQEVMSNDMSMMHFWLKVLRASFGGARIPIAEECIAKHYNAENWCGIYHNVLKQFELDVQIPLVYIPALPDDPRPACLIWKKDFHAALRRRTKSRLIALGINQHFLNRASYHAIMTMFAHECAHILLESTNHPLRACEKFVDLTAMHFGFCEHFLIGQRYTARWEKNAEYSCGYLTHIERAYAARHLGYQPVY